MAEEMYARNKKKGNENIFNLSGKQNKYPLIIINSAPSQRCEQMEHKINRARKRRRCIKNSTGLQASRLNITTI